MSKTGRKRSSDAAPVQSLVRGLMLLEHLSEASSGLNLTEISQSIGIPAPTVYRMLSTLERMNFVVQDVEHGLWSIGVSAFRVGSAFVSQRDFITVARPYMQKLMRDTGETSNLAILEGAGVVFLAQVECTELMRMAVKLGSRGPIHATGVGKAMLSELPDAEVSKLLCDAEMHKFTEYTITTETAMLKELKRIRKCGFAMDNQEQSLGLRCLSANIYNEYGEALVAISISGPVTRVSDERVKELGKRVAMAAQQITQALGGDTDPSAAV